MLTTLAAAGVFLLRARKIYPIDVATAGVGWTPPRPAPETDPAPSALEPGSPPAPD